MFTFAANRKKLEGKRPPGARPPAGAFGSPPRPAQLTPPQTTAPETPSQAWPWGSSLSFPPRRLPPTPGKPSALPRPWGCLGQGPGLPALSRALGTGGVSQVAFVFKPGSLVLHMRRPWPSDLLKTAELVRDRVAPEPGLWTRSPWVFPAPKMASLLCPVGRPRAEAGARGFPFSPSHWALRGSPAPLT